jgi:hypothetical protein
LAAIPGYQAANVSRRVGEHAKVRGAELDLVQPGS